MLRLSALTLIVIAVAGIAAPVPPDAQKRVLYFPTTVGTKWVYDLGGFEMVEEITDVSEKDGKYVVTIGTFDEKGEMISQSKTKYLVSEKGVFFGKLRFLKETEFPNALLKIPVKLEDRWELEILELEAKVVCTVGALEEVKVQAGKFQAVRIESTVLQSKEPIRKTTTWYAPDVGKVKMVTRSMGEEITSTLKSFTPGKK